MSDSVDRLARRIATEPAVGRRGFLRRAALLFGGGAALALTPNIVLAADKSDKSDKEDGNSKSCPPGMEMCNRVCRVTSIDPDNCGSCGTSCPPGKMCRGGVCVACVCQPVTGGCTTSADCGPATECATPVCVNGTCQTTFAPAGTPTQSQTPGDCKRNVCSGMGGTTSVPDDTDVPPTTNPCTRPVCTMGVLSFPNSPNGTACPGGTCQAGVCVTPCPSGQTLCNNVCVSTLTNPNNCGACGVVCTTLNGIGACINGKCGVGTCNAGFANCDGNAANGCETDISTSTANCGACGAVCTTPNGIGACVNGVCRIGACNPGFADCNGNAADGCETNVNTSATNCGSCGRVCASGTMCVSGVCV